MNGLVQTTYGYDIHGRRIRETLATEYGTSADASAPQMEPRAYTAPETTTLYDALDNIVTVIAPGGTDAATNTLARTTTRRSYNAFGQILSVTEAADTPIARTTAFQYDKGGRLEWQQVTAVGQEASRKTAYQYDPLNRVVHQTDTATAGVAKGVAPTARHTYFGYDVHDNRITVVDPLGRRTEVRYDQLDRPYETVEVAPARLLPQGVGDLSPAKLWSQLLPN